MLERLPEDPVLLLSVVNTKLRDYYLDLDQFCEEQSVEKEILIKKLESIDYVYDVRQNQFI